MSPWRHRPSQLSLVVFVLAMLAAVLVIARSHFTTDLSAFLPATPDEEQRLLIDQLQRGAASRSVMVAVTGGDASLRGDASRALANLLRKDRAFSSVNNGERTDYAAVGTLLFEQRYALSPTVTRERFQSAEGLHAALLEAAMRLASPEGAAFKPLWPKDPTGEVLTVAESLLPSQAPRTEQGLWVSRDGERAVMLLTLAADARASAEHAHAIATVRTAFASIAKPGLALQLTGPSVFAEQSRELIEREAKQLSIWGAMAVALILGLSFGTLQAVALAALPVVAGVAVGVACVSLVFGQVHGMTLGFGATLVGEAVDYAIYYLIQARERASGRDGERAVLIDAEGSTSTSVPTRGGSARWWREGWPTVRLGLMTSVCGFAALVFSGFPGLAQLGVFSIAGLVAAALVTRFVLPTLAPVGAKGQGVRAALGRATAWAVDRAPSLRLALWAALLASLAALLLLPKPLWRGDLVSMSPVPASALATDLRLREDLGASDARTLVVVRGATLDAALAAAEGAGTKLQGLVEDGVLDGFESPARLLPSLAMQSTRRAALPGPSELLTLLPTALRDLPFKPEAIAAFASEVEAARKREPLTARAYQGTPLAAALDALTFKREDGSWVALLPLQWSSAATADAAAQSKADHALRSRLKSDEARGAVVVDIKQSLDNLYAHYVREALWQAGLGALAVVVLLGVVLRDTTRLLRVVAPLAVAVVITLAALAALKVPLGILHLIGLLLVVAVGSNYALFFDQLAQSRVTSPIGAGANTQASSDDADAFASLLLANLTTVVTFALMATTDIAALSAIGVVVAPGAALALVASAAMRRTSGKA